MENIEKSCNTCKANKICDHNKYGFENCGNYIPEDVVEVVRCKDCKYNDNGDCIHPDNITHSYDSEWYEYDHYISIYSDHFCSYGERRN